MDNQKILLIEDDKLIREIYTFTLQKAKYNILSAADGDEGIILVQNNQDAKLILLDVIMPKMNGVEVLRHLKSDQSTKDIPVLLLSNLTDEKTVDEALEFGAYGYLVKAQISPSELVNKVREMVEYYDKRKQGAQEK